MTQPTTSVPRQIGVVGSRSAQDRPWLRRLGIAAVGLVMTADVAGLSGIEPAKMGIAQGPEQTVVAQVVGKIMQPEGAVLTKGFLGRGQGDAWQPGSEVSTSNYWLVLSLPGELHTQTVAVSRDIYNDYCNHLTREDFFPRGRTTMNTEMFAGCGKVYGVNGQVVRDAPDQLDTVSLSFTRSRIDDSIQLTRLEGREKLAQGSMEKAELMRKTERDLSPRRPPMG